MNEARDAEEEREPMRDRPMAWVVYYLQPIGRGDSESAKVLDGHNRTKRQRALDRRHLQWKNVESAPTDSFGFALFTQASQPRSRTQ